MAYPYNSYMNPYGVQYYPQPMQMQPMQTQMQQPVQQVQPQQIKQQLPLQGKSVDSVEAAKTVEYPLDGSINYFPVTDGSAIVTKQLNMENGTSKVVIYKPEVITPAPKQEVPEFVTKNDFEAKTKEIDITTYQEEIKALKTQIKSLTDEIEELKNTKTTKSKKED